jgi:hypothetical protein
MYTAYIREVLAYFILLAFSFHLLYSTEAEHCVGHWEAKVIAIAVLMKFHQAVPKLGNFK